MKTAFRLNHIFCAALVLLSGVGATWAQVPQLLNYQGRIAVNGTNFTGIGQFKFALVDGGSNLTFNTFWSNDGTSSGGGQPTASVPLPVTKGLYSVLLGDTTLSNMTALPASVFNNNDVRLRAWFNDGVTGFQQLTPDQRLAAVGYAIMAGTAQTVPDGSITTSKIALGAVGAAQIALGSIGTALMAPGISGLMNLQMPPSNQIQAVANSLNLFTNSQPDQLTLPANPNVGDRVQATAGAGGFTIVANTGQSIQDPSAFGMTPRGSYANNGWNCVACSSDGSKWIAGAGGHYLYTSTNYGVNWTQQTHTVGSLGYWTCVACSTNGSNLIAGAAGHYLYTSTNYGVNWTQKTNAGGGYWQCVACSSDGSKLIAGAYNDYYLYTSTNYGVNWTQQTNAGSNNWKCVASSSDGSKLIAGAQNDYLYTSTNYGVNWTQQTNAGSDGWICVACSSDGSKLIAGAFYSGYLYVLPNYITQWSTVYVYGSAYSNIELIYAGNGLWVPVSYAGSFTIQ